MDVFKQGYFKRVRRIMRTRAVKLRRWNKTRAFWYYDWNYPGPGYYRKNGLFTYDFKYDWYHGQVVRNRKEQRVNDVLAYELRYNLIREE